MPKEKKIINPCEFRNTAYRLILAGILLLLIAIHLVNIFFYPDTQIIPTDFFFALALAQMFLLWFDGVREKNFIIWAHNQRDALNEMKLKFTMLTSHELMTPIAVIKGYLGLLNDGLMGPLNADQKNSLDTITRHVGRLEQLRTSLSNLYADARSAARKNTRPSSLPDLIRAVTADAMPFVKKRNLSLALDIDERLPLLAIDAAQIRQVVMGLVLNSIRFTPDGGRITVRAHDAGRDIRVEVEDNGIGIPKDKLRLIFEGFYEAGDTEQHHSGSIEFKSGGLGLGLVIAKNIIESYKGKIWAESDPGKSTKVLFTLPK